MSSWVEIFKSGGFIMYPLLILSLWVWAVIFERVYSYQKVRGDLQSFQSQALKLILSADTGELEQLRGLCQGQSRVPTARLILFALDRINSKDSRLREDWLHALERQRMVMNQELKRGLWVLGTIGTSAPFIGLFGTVVGILRTFHQMAQAGTGGFAVVAAGISEALIATASGIIVAVIAVMAYNIFQTQWSRLVLTIRVNTEELASVIDKTVSARNGN